MSAQPATKVWDLLVRSVHWSLAALIVIELFNEAGANPWHRYLGYVAAALVVARLAWGCGDRGHASLAAMAASARQAPSYLTRPDAHSAGHTPPGALMAFALWTPALMARLAMPQPVSQSDGASRSHAPRMLTRLMLGAV